MTTALATLTSKLAARLDMGDNNGQELTETLKQTAFKSGGTVTDAQMTALLIIANQHGLNPWTKEIYAFPDGNGIVPVVGVDGWTRIINSHPQFDGIEFEQDDESCTAIIWRKDRSRPVRVTEYAKECQKNTSPWRTHPRRMLRHRALIQCARLAFSFGGIYDTEEAETILEEKDITPVSSKATVMPQNAIIESTAKTLEPYPDNRFHENYPKWRDLVEAGKRSADQILTMIETRNTLTDAQRNAILDMGLITNEAA